MNLTAPRPLARPARHVSRQRLIVLAGPPGAGKTTLRAHLLHADPNIQVISLDQLRGALSTCGCTSNQATTGIAVGAAFAAAEHAFTTGSSVLWDATNSRRGERLPLARLAREVGIRCELKVLLPPLDVVCGRNADRDDARCRCGYARRVPDNVVIRMHGELSMSLRDHDGMIGEGWDAIDVDREAR